MPRPRKKELGHAANGQRNCLGCTMELAADMCMLPPTCQPGNAAVWLKPPPVPPEAIEELLPLLEAPYASRDRASPGAQRSGADATRRFVTGKAGQVLRPGLTGGPIPQELPTGVRLAAALDETTRQLSVSVHHQPQDGQSKPKPAIRLSPLGWSKGRGTAFPPPTATRFPMCGMLAYSQADRKEAVPMSLLTQSVEVLR